MSDGELLIAARSAVEAFDVALKSERDTAKASFYAEAAHDQAIADRRHAARAAADAMAAAADGGATQQQIADAIGKSQPWVSAMLKWRKTGKVDGTPLQPSPFAEASRLARSKRHAEQLSAAQAETNKRKPHVDQTCIAGREPETPAAPAEQTSAAHLAALEDQFNARWRRMNAEHRTDYVEFVLKNSHVKLTAAA